MKNNWPQRNLENFATTGQDGNIFKLKKNFKNTFALLTDLKEPFTNFTLNFTVEFVELKVDPNWVTWEG